MEITSLEMEITMPLFTILEAPVLLVYIHSSQGKMIASIVLKTGHPCPNIPLFSEIRISWRIKPLQACNKCNGRVDMMLGVGEVGLLDVIWLCRSTDYGATFTPIEQQLDSADRNPSLWLRFYVSPINRNMVHVPLESPRFTHSLFLVIACADCLPACYFAEDILL